MRSITDLKWAVPRLIREEQKLISVPAGNSVESAKKLWNEYGEKSANMLNESP
jgi:hypothetical protein